jgi:hypothetical protein
VIPKLNFQKPRLFLAVVLARKSLTCLLIVDAALEILGTAGLSLESLDQVVAVDGGGGGDSGASIADIT